MAIGVRQVASIAVAAAAGWFVAANGIAAHLARSDPRLAASIAPDADRLSRLSQQYYLDEGYGEAAEAARRALALSPLQTRAARVLGQVELALGHEDAGLAAMNVATTGGWRDTVTQYWILRAALASGDYPGALQRADALIRREVATSALLAELRPWLAEPAFRAALAGRMADAPDWRGLMFLDWRKAAPGELPGILALVADLDRDRMPVTDVELFPLTERMLELGATGPARALWAGKAPRSGWAPGNAVYDGRFAVAQRRGYGETPPRFEWWIDPARTGLTSVETAPDGRGAALRIGSNAGHPVVFARQTLMLPAGRHRLSARIFARNAGELDGLDFALRCYPQDRALALGDRRLTRAGSDQLRYASVAVVDADCPRQDLMIAADGVPLGGTLSITDIAVVPQS